MISFESPISMSEAPRPQGGASRIGINRNSLRSLTPPTGRGLRSAPGQRSSVSHVAQASIVKNEFRIITRLRKGMVSDTIESEDREQA